MLTTLTVLFTGFACLVVVAFYLLLFGYLLYKCFEFDRPDQPPKWVCTRYIASNGSVYYELHREE